MDLATILRRVKREFGDEYGITINDNDIFDWINEAQLRILRDTTSADIVQIRAANTFPYTPTDNVTFKRVAINNRALKQISIDEIDAIQGDTSIEGTPLYWYELNNRSVYLYPAPKVTDTFDVLVTYAKVPSRVSLVAPYLKWTTNPPVNQFAWFDADPDFSTDDLLIYFEVTFVNPLNQFTLFAKGANTSAASSYSWILNYQASLGNGSFRMFQSNGTLARTADLQVPAFTAGEKRKFKLTYTASTGTTNIYDVSTTGIETLIDTDVQSTLNLSTTAYDISFGAMQDGFGYNNAEFLLHYFKLLYDNGSTNQIILEFDGARDLPNLPVLPATPFTVSSGQPMYLNGTLQQYSSDTALTVPEVWHEDVVRFCLARAHLKNRNSKAAEDAMGEFEQATTLRRHESNSADTPSYKMADPFDYGMDFLDYG